MLIYIESFYFGAYFSAQIHCTPGIFKQLVFGNKIFENFNFFNLFIFILGNDLLKNLLN